MNRKLSSILYISVGLGLLFFIMDVAIHAEAAPSPAIAGELNRGWHTLRDGASEEISLPYQMPVRRGEEFTIHGRLPEGLGEDDYLCTYASMQQLRVYVEDQLILTYGSPGESYPQSAYSEWVAIPMEPAYSGKTVTVTYRNNYIHFSSAANGFYCGTFDACIRAIWWGGSNRLLLCLIVFCVGLTTLVLSHLLYNSLRESLVVRYLGWFLLLLAVWGLSQTKLLPLLLKEPYIPLVLSVVPLMLVPIPISLAFRLLIIPEYLQRELENFIYLFGVSFAVCVMLHYTGVAYLVDTVWFSLLFLAIFFFYVILFGFVELRSNAGYPEFRREIYYSMLMHVCLALLLGVLLVGASIWSTHLMGDGRRGLDFSLLAITLIASFIMLRLIVVETQTIGKINKQLAHSQTSLMLSQIKPHFLYNTLNSIRTLIRTSPGQADDMVYNFSRFLRSNMNSLNSKEPIPFAKELDHIIAYTNIEKVCFPNISVEFDIQTKNFSVPPLTIQPVVENAIKHGVSKRASGGVVRLKTYESPTAYNIEISDNGVGFIPEEIEQKEESCGLKNIRVRLENLARANIRIRSTIGVGTTVVIAIPKQKRKEQTP